MMNVVFSNKGSENPDYPANESDVVLGPFESIKLPSAAWDEPLVGAVGTAASGIVEYAYEVKRSVAGWSVQVGDSTFERENLIIS